MLTKKALAGGGAAAIMLLSLAISTASANRLSMNTSQWVATWREMTIEGSFGRINCPLTLEGELHSRTFAKTRSSLIGYVNEARSGTCSGFTGTVLRERLPWHVQYDSFTGTLPTIASVSLRIIGFEFKIRETFGVECLFRSTEARPLSAALTREAGSVVRSVTLSGRFAAEACAGLEATFGGTSTSFTIPPPPSAIRLTLI